MSISYNMLTREIERQREVSHRPQTTLTLGEFRSGERDAIGRAHRNLVGFAKKFTAPQDAEDLVQDVFVRVSGPLSKKSPDEFPNGNIMPYLRTAVVRTRINEVRRAQRHAGTEATATLSEGVETIIGDPKTNVEDDVVRRLGIESALKERKPDPFTETVLRVDRDELSYIEAAEELGVPIGTVMSKLHRGRKKLREDLKDFASN